MYNDIKKNEGLTLATVIISVLIMVIISTMLVLRASDSIEVDRLNRMNNEIKNLQDNILVYYSKTGQIPEKGLYSGTNNDFKNYKNINDNENYYIIDVNKLDNVILKNGKGNWNNDSSTDDVYVVNEATLKVYYVKGVKVSGKMYYTLNQGESVNIDKSNIVNKKNKLTIEKGYGIANLPELKTGMIPVVWNETASKWEEVKDTINDYWYDYGNNMPANMMLQDGSIYVWIPRYAITNDTLKFVDNEDKFYSNDEIYEAQSCFGSSPGIWVAKYEASRADATVENEGISSNIKITDSVKKWTGITDEEKEAKCKNIVLLGTNGLDKVQVKSELITSEYKTAIIELLSKTNAEVSQYSIMKETSSNIVNSTDDFVFRPIIVSLESSEAPIIPTPTKWDTNIVSETRQGNIPVPNGFYYVGGTKASGFAISDNKQDENKGGNYPVADTKGNQFVWKPVDDITNWDDDNTFVYIYNNNGYITYINSENKELVENNNSEETSINNQVLKSSVQEYGGYYASLDNQGDEILRLYVKPSKVTELYYYDNDSMIGKQMVIVGNEYGSLLEPTKEGYNFEGWYTDLNYTLQVTNATEVTTQSSYNLYAKWSLIIYTVYFEKPYSWDIGSGIYLHAWDKNGNIYKDWLSDDEKMTLVSGNVYKYELPMIYSNILFRADNTDKSQTIDTTLKGNNLTYRVPNTGTIYLQTPPSDWEGTPHAYTWVDGSSPVVENSAWPGADMELVDSLNRYYSYQILNGHDKIIFNNNAANSQTADMDIPELDMLYIQNPGTWRYWVTTEGTDIAKAVQPGDYVEYDSTILNKQGNSVSSTKLTYTSPIGTIPTSSSEEITHGNGSASQTFTATSNTKWQVLSVNETTGQVELISEDAIKTDSSGNFILYGARGYLFGEQELNEICKIYGYGYGADTKSGSAYEVGGPYDTTTGKISGTGARSISMADINKLAQIAETDFTTLNSNYGSTSNPTTAIYYPVLKSTNTTYPGQSSSTKTGLKYTYYNYDATKIIDENLRNLVLNSAFWISSRCVATTSTYANFGVYATTDQKIATAGLCGGNSTSLYYKSVDNFGVRPIVTLKSGLLVEKSTEENTWIIK